MRIDPRNYFWIGLVFGTALMLFSIAVSFAAVAFHSFTLMILDWLFLGFLLPKVYEFLKWVDNE
jgi:hypothetical protein